MLIGIYEGKAFLIKGTYQIERDGGDGVIMVRSSQYKYNEKISSKGLFQNHH